MNPVHQDNQRLHELLRALEVEVTQVQQDDTVELDPPEEINSSSMQIQEGTSTTQSPIDETFSPMGAEQDNDSGAAAFDHTTDIANYFQSGTSDCSFSSDPDAPLCNTTSYRCTNTQTLMTIPYDYEIHYAASDKDRLDHWIQVIEGNMLDQLATQMNLQHCAKNTRRLQTNSSNVLLDRSTGISLLPRDSTTAEPCLDAELNASLQECRSVKGALTVYTYLTTKETALPAQAQSKLKQAVLTVVQQGIADDKFLMAVNGQRVVFIGDRQAVLSSQSSTDGDWSSRSIGLVSVAVVLILAVTTTIWYLRNRFHFGKGSRYVRDTSGSSVGSEPRNDHERPDGNLSVAPQASSREPQLVPSVTEPVTSWSQSMSQDQGTECIEFDDTSTMDPSTTTSFAATTFDMDAIIEAPTDLGNYQFSYDQGISPINATFDNLYEDIEIPTFDEASRGSMSINRRLHEY